MQRSFRRKAETERSGFRPDEAAGGRVWKETDGMSAYMGPPYFISAYDIACKHGFRGSEPEWLASLRGPQGLGFVLRGSYPTEAALRQAHAAGKAGDCYKVGTDREEAVFYWDPEKGDWESVRVTGSQGPPGETGQTGPRGIQGPAGPRGEQGADGQRGPQGCRGGKGDRGEKGDKGDKGDRGETGAQGPRGCRGPAGPESPAGPQGKDGEPGPPGKGLSIESVFSSAEELEKAVPAPGAGDSYGVGEAPPYEILTWDGVGGRWVSNGSIQGPRGEAGIGIESIRRTGGTGAAGTLDTYTVTLTDGRTASFTVYNGADGAGTEIIPLRLTAEGWTEEGGMYAQTAAAPGVLADEGAQLIHVSPASADREDWEKAGVRCTAQGDGTLAFAAAIRPERDLSGWAAIQAAGTVSGGGGGGCACGGESAADEEVREMLDEVFGGTGEDPDGIATDEEVSAMLSEIFDPVSK